MAGFLSISILTFWQTSNTWLTDWHCSVVTCWKNCNMDVTLVLYSKRNGLKWPWWGPLIEYTLMRQKKKKKKGRERENSNSIISEEEWIPIPCLPNADHKTNTVMGKLSPKVLPEDSSKWRSSDTFLAGLLPAASLRRWEINLHIFYTEFILTQEEGFVG